MTYIDDAINAVAEELPGLPDRLTDLYALLCLTRGVNTTLRDVHDAWAIWRHQARPDHPAIVPFDELTPDVQELDRKYADGIIRATYKTLGFQP